MTYRARTLARIVIFTVVAALAANVFISPNAAGPGHDGLPAQGRPVKPLMVPRPAALISGHVLAKAAPAVEVATAFVAAYLTYDTTRQQEADYLAGLPRVSAAFRPALADQVKNQWELSTADRAISSVAADPVCDVVSSSATEVLLQVGVQQQLSGRDRPQSLQRTTLMITVVFLDQQWQISAVQSS